MPDILIILRDRPVRREVSRLADIDQRHPRPFLRVHGIVRDRLVFAHNISVKIRECLEPVFSNQFVFQALKTPRISFCQHPLSVDKVYRAPEIGIRLIPFPCTVIPFLIEPDHLPAALPEDIDVLSSHTVRDLHICPVQRSKRDRSVQHELHVSGAGRLLGSKADLLGQVTGRDHLFRGSHIIVFDQHDLDPLGNLRILFDHLRQGQ